MAIQDDIQIINEGLSWLKTNKPEQYEQALFQMLDGRRRLRRQLDALNENPAIGAFGESQTGKSYQINTLLNRYDKAFVIKAEGYPEGVGFVDKINPIGDDREATGVVTRMTSFVNDPGRYNAKYPVIVKLLTPGQLATILASGYYSNIRDYTTYCEDELREISELLWQRYGNRPELPGAALVEDDILDIKSYLTNYLKAATQGLARSNYFETLTRIIRRVPTGEWSQVLKYLWHENEVITRLFERLCATLQRMDFAREVYVPVETVIHGGENRRTIMSVACLNGLDESDWAIRTDVYVPEGGDRQRLRREADMPTSELCAVSAEVVFKIDAEYLDETRTYCYDEAHAGQPGYLSRSSRGKLADSVSKSLLRDTDLLDFPGARSNEQQDEAFCTEGARDKSGQSVIVKLFLRGKIAYLFNYYSESHKMKVLLFCHHHKQSEVKNLHILLDQWVRRNVGNTVAERAATLARTGGISPLFLVATKINIDMTPKNYDSHNNATALNTRWEDRFRTVLLDAVLNWSNVDWFRNWSAPGVSFKDTYLLRSYEYCSCTPTGNQMFSGYDVATSSPEQRLEMDHDYYRLLHSTFVNNGSVRELFFDPDLAWDVVSTLNNDGSLYIIERMGRVAEAASQIRNEQMKRERDDIMTSVRNILDKEYDSDNDNDKLLHNIETASNLRWEFDTSCSTDSYYFGHLLQALQVTEAECLSIVHELVHGTAINNDLNNLSDYQLIINRCRNFEGCTTDDERWERLIKAYGWRTKENARQQLARRNIDPEVLFKPRTRPKTDQVFIADHIMDLWRRKVNSEQLMNTFTSADDGFNPVLMKELVTTLIESADRLRLADNIAERIRSEVNVANVSQIRESLVADIMASTLNSFVCDFGYSMLGEPLKEKARAIAEENMLPVYDYICKERRESYAHDELAEMFEQAFDRGSALTESFDNHYNEWLEYMTIAFVVHLKRSELPAEVNEALGTLINRITY